MAYGRVSLVAVSLALSACVGGEAGAPAPDPAHAAARARWPSARLPFRVRTDKLLVGRGFQYVPLSVGAAQEVTSPLLALVPMPGERIAVIFPPDDRDGLDLAFAGLDHPWERIPISDLPFERIGSIDAIAGPDGTLHIIIREGHGRRDITYVRFREGSMLESRIVPTPGLAESTGTRNGCDDAAIEISPAGSIDVLYRHLKPYSFMLARMAPGSDEFVLETALGNDPDPTHNYIGGVGCRLRLAHDDTGFPVIAALYDSDLTSNRYVISYVRGADGYYRRHGPYFPEPKERLRYTGQFELYRHPLGFLFSGPERYKDNTFIEPFVVRHSNVVGAGLHNAKGPFAVDRTSFPEAEGQAVMTDCARAGLVYRDPDTKRWDTLGLGTLSSEFDTNFCASNTRFAPVIADTQVDDYRAVKNNGHLFDYIFASQDVPYAAMLCALDDGALVICEGAHVETRPDLPPETPVSIVSATPPQGALVPVDQDLRATFTFDRWDKQAMSYRPDVNILMNGRALDSIIGFEEDPAARTVTVTISKAELIPGISYRIGFPSLSGNAIRSRWVSPETPPAVVTYTVEGDTFTTPDPRTIPVRRVCVRSGGETAACDPIDIPAAIDSKVELVFDSPMEWAFGTMFELVSGSEKAPAAPTAVGDFTPPQSTVTISVNASLQQPGAEYTMDVSALVSSIWVSKIDPMDRIVHVRALP